MQQIELCTWVIGPGRGGDRVIQVSQCEGEMGLFFGETGLPRGAGVYYESRVFDPDEEDGPWFPSFASLRHNDYSLSIDVAHWLLAVVLLIAWLAWFTWRNRRIANLPAS